MRTGAALRTTMPIVLLLLFATTAANAAPTCQDRAGLTMKCGTPGAMPVGWEPAPAQELKMGSAEVPPSDSRDMWKAVCLVALFLVLTALLPDFDGSRGGDWDRQEDNDRRV